MGWVSFFLLSDFALAKIDLQRTLDEIGKGKLFVQRTVFHFAQRRNLLALKPRLELIFA
jgi:hypothetical protein